MNATPPTVPSGPSRVTRTAVLRDRLAHGLRFAFGTLTVFPVPVSRWDRETARVGMVCAPFAGLTVGLAAGAVGWVLYALGSGPLLTAVLTAAVPAVLTRGLHLDGLADVADGLGSGRPAPEALRVMKRSDIGPFGVVTLLFLVLSQVAALQELFVQGGAAGAGGAVVAGVASRSALTWACRAGVPAARGEGLGATVAGCVPAGTALVTAVASGLLTAGVWALAGDGMSLTAEAARGLSAVVLALSAAEMLLRHCSRRFGGVTGDVLGAVAEVAATAALLALAFVSDGA